MRRPRSRPLPITRASCATDVPLALDVLSDILTDPSFDPEELRREQNVIVQEIGAAEDTPDDLIWDRLQETAFHRSADGALDPGHAGDRALVRPHQLATYLARNYRAPEMVVAAAGAVDHRAVVAEVERGSPSFAGPRGTGAGAGAFRRRGSHRNPRSRAGAYRARHEGLAATGSEPLQPAGVHQRAWRRDVLAPVPGGAGAARLVLCDLCVPRSVFRYRACSASMPAPTWPMSPN